jgi:hypothetical protein
MTTEMAAEERVRSLLWDTELSKLEIEELVPTLADAIREAEAAARQEGAEAERAMVVAEAQRRHARLVETERRLGRGDTWGAGAKDTLRAFAEDVRAGRHHPPTKETP